jgi:predicted MFS family arabinose efflux permease
VGVWNAVGALALAVGPLLGGLLSENLGWGWIFFINLPIGALTLGLGALAIRVPSAKRRSKLDLPGVATSSGTLAALTFALIEGPNFGWTSPVILACLAAAPLLGIAFVLIERRAKAPMMALGLFRRGVFSGGLATMFIWAFGLFGIYFFTTIYLQDVAGFTPTQAGLSFVPMALLMVAGSVFSQPAAEWIGARRSVALSMGLIACGIAGAALLGEDATFAQVMIPLVVIGVGGGFTTSLTATIVGAMPAGEVGVATALLNTVRQTGGLLGIACIGAVVANFPDFLMGYHMGLLFSATLVAIGAVLAFLTLRRVTPAGLPERPTRTAELDHVA